MNRNIKFSKAINEATDLCMEKDKNVYLMGLGVPDPTGFFGTTMGLQEKYGEHRVLDMPTAENGMTGIAIGTAFAGMRPIMAHHRIEFAMLAIEQIMNQAGNWHYMFGGQSSIPIVIRMLIGRGWGQGPQHSQCLHAMFAHHPGLKVVMPTTPHDAKGLLIAAVEDNNPVIFIEHRWLHNIFGNVPEGYYRTPIGKARIARTGKDVTIIATSYMVLESLLAANSLENNGIDAEIIDLRTIRPMDTDCILESVSKTGRVIVADLGWRSFGVASEIITLIAEKMWNTLKFRPQRITLPDIPTPCTPELAKYYYPRAIHIVNNVREMLGLSIQTETEAGLYQDIPLDIPNKEFAGPF